MKLHRLAWMAGIVGLPVSHYWLVAQVEPFYSSIYCFLWWSYIFTVDFAVCRLRGHSLLRDQPREFLFSRHLVRAGVAGLRDGQFAPPQLVLCHVAIRIFVVNVLSRSRFRHGTSGCF